MTIKVIVSLAVGFALVSSAEAQPDASALGARLVGSVTDADVAKTRTLLREWKATGKPWPSGPDEKPLLFLAIEGREKTHAEIIDVLLENGADVRTRGPLGRTALHWAAANGYTERTEQILRYRPPLEAADDRGRTPLLLAHGDVAEKLLAAGANVLAADKDGLTALHYAAQTGARHLSILFAAGFTVIDARSKAGVTPLHVAAVEGSDSAASWLLDHGAKLDAVVATDYDYLPQEVAPGYGNELRMKRGSTPMRLASIEHDKSKWSSGRHRAVLELLQVRGGKGSGGAASMGILTAASLFATLPLAIAFFAGLLFLDARITGWHALAQRFAATAEPATVHARQNGGVGAVGLVHLKGLMRAAPDDRGLYFAFPKFLNAGHPPLQIPWSEMRLLSDKRLLGTRVLRLQIGEPKLARLALQGGIADAVADRLGDQQIR